MALKPDFINKIFNENCLTGMAKLPDNSVDCCVTSPPYFGLRDYGTASVTFPATTLTILGFKQKFKSWTGNYGQEPTPAMFVAHTVQIFNEVHRVLKPAGTLWVNFGDSYAGSGGASGHTSETKNLGAKTSKYGAVKSGGKKYGLKSKDLIGIPWMVAFALRDAGWYLRQDIIWAKPNPMPESVIDRCTKSHEYFFMFSKSAKYYYDAVAIKTPPAESSIQRLSQDIENQSGSNRAVGKTNSPMKAVGAITAVLSKPDKQRGHARRHDGFNDRWDSMSKEEQQALGANKRSVWNVATKPFKEAHFATFPQDLIVDCIKAGTSEYGCCSECGKPHTRMFDKELVPTKKAVKATVIDNRDMYADKQDQGSNHQKDGHRNGMITQTTTTGWQNPCGCRGGVVPAVILDPFAGALTTPLVAKKLNRNYVGFELNAQYIKIGETRMRNELGLFL